MVANVMEIYSERLASVQKRISIVRGLLEDATTASDLSVDGLSERFDRSKLVDELRTLEADEIRLTGLINGTRSRVYKVVLK